MSPSLLISYSWNAPARDRNKISVQWMHPGDHHALATLRPRAPAVSPSHNSHCSFSSSFPRLVMLNAPINSLKSIVPLLFLSARGKGATGGRSAEGAEGQSALRRASGRRRADGGGTEREREREDGRTKDLEDVLGELFRIAEGEELLVDARELVLVELA